MPEGVHKTTEGFPGFTAAWGSTAAYDDPPAPAPFFWLRIERRPYLSAAEHVRGWAMTMADAKAEALSTRPIAVIESIWRQE